ncbi:MAG: vanadium-dependent haloperoxidase [Gemmatimonadales bacterium]
MRWIRQVSVAAAGMMVLFGCSDGSTDPVAGPGSEPEAATAEAKVSRATESARWNEVARNLSQTYAPPQHVGLRGLAYLSLAQYNAVVAAEGHRARPSSRGAVAGASVAVLSWVYPSEAGYLESLIGPPEPAAAASYRAGVAIGRAIGAQVVASAGTDNFNLVWTGTVPVGPGSWFSLAVPPAPPIAPRLGEMRPFFLIRGSQFRPPPPPSFGSPAFLAALAEVRRFSDTRTEEQDRLAKFWALPGGFKLIPAYPNLLATDLIGKYHKSERAAAHILALINQAAMDGFIACHDTKYTYWLLRPSMADPLITLSVGLPNHPSFPSNHACVSGAQLAALGTLFPREARRLRQLADDAAYSRVVGGIHYRFDGSVGLAVGRAVAEWAVAHDVREGLPYPIH